MDTSMMARMKEPEAENARLKKMYVQDKVKVEIVTEALAKNGEAVLKTWDSSAGSYR